MKDLKIFINKKITVSLPEDLDECANMNCRNCALAQIDGNSKPDYLKCNYRKLLGLMG